MLTDTKTRTAKPRPKSYKLADARAKRDDAYTILCEGRDPTVVKKLKIEANIEASRQTFERIAREWHGNTKP